MMTKHRAHWWIVSIACIVALGWAASTAGAQEGPTLTISDEGIADLPTIDPHLAGDTNTALVDNLLFNGLTRIDKTGTAVPDLATWTVSNGGKTYLFTLNKAARFSDGNAMTADDVAWSLERALSPAITSKGGFGISMMSLIDGANAYNSGKATSITGIHVQSPTQLQIDLTAGAGYFPAVLSGSWGAILEKSAGDKLIGAGPFMLENWAHGQSITVVANPNYLHGTPKLHSVVVRFFADPDTAFNAYLTGSVDVMGVVHFPSAKLTQARQLPGFQASPLLGTTYLVPNAKTAPFMNAKVRLAFSQAIDRKAIAQLLSGLVHPSDRVLPPGIACYDATLSVPGYDPAAARKDLADAGYPDGQGLPPITYTYGANGPDMDRIAAALQQMWQQNLGVHVSLNAMEMGSYFKALDARDFQVAMIEWGADYPDPQDFLSLQLQSGGQANNSGFSSAQFDQLTSEADVSSNQAQRCQLYEQAEKDALDAAAWMPLYNPSENVLIRPTVSGLTVGPLGLYTDNWATVNIGK